MTTTELVDEQADKRQVQVEKQITYSATMGRFDRTHDRHRADMIDMIRNGSHWRYYHTSARQQKNKWQA